MNEEEIIKYAGKLNQLEYQRERKEIAKALGVGVTGLDKIIRDSKGSKTKTVANKLIHGAIDHTGRKIGNAIWKALFK